MSSSGRDDHPGRAAAKEVKALILRIHKSVAKCVERGRYLGRAVLAEEHANRVLGMAIDEGRGYAAGKLGDIELRAVRFYLGHPRGDMRRRSLQRLLDPLYYNAGVFPPTEETFSRFCSLFLDVLPSLDLVAVWYNGGEARILRTHSSSAVLGRLRCLEPYYHASPWSARLAGRKVLVVSPFASSIESQYRRRLDVWRGHPGMLPEFDLITIKAPHHDHLNKSVYADWVEALEALKSQVAAVPFDVLIVGAGAWGLPLAVFAKELGKVGIHLGGATQVLFGIKGRRWENHPVIANLINEAWVRPSAEETPRGNERIEGGCYW